MLSIEDTRTKTKPLPFITRCLVRRFFIASGRMVYFVINKTKIEYLKMVYLEGLTLEVLYTN